VGMASGFSYVKAPNILVLKLYETLGSCWPTPVTYYGMLF